MKWNKMKAWTRCGIVFSLGYLILNTLILIVTVAYENDIRTICNKNNLDICMPYMPLFMFNILPAFIFDILSISLDSLMPFVITSAIINLLFYFLVGSSIGYMIMKKIKK